MKYIFLFSLVLGAHAVSHAQTAPVTTGRTAQLSPRVKALIQANALANQKRTLDANIAAAKRRNAELLQVNTSGSANTVPVNPMPLTPNRKLEATPVKTRQ